MDKKTFIRDLGRSLSVLQEDELRDIIGEYEQHIDMKVKSGLTEEEAIADFGSLTELSSEILEAYHVRADYAAAEGEKGKRFSFAEGEKAGKAGKEILGQTGELCARTGRQTLRGLKRIGAWLWGVMLFWKAQITRPFAWARQKYAAYRGDRAGHLIHMEDGEQMQAEKAENRQRPVSAIWGGRRKRSGESGFIKSVVSGMCGFLAVILRFCFKAAYWCIRMTWNICWIGFSVCCGGMGLFCLFGLGTLVVLLINGYPLAGVVIGCLGLNLCLFAAAGFGMTLLWRKEKRTETAERTAENRDEPDQFPVIMEQEGKEHA